MTLNRVVDNFFQETEQVAFCTQNVIPGIGFSDDPLLHGRNFSYLDTQIKRLGSPNFARLPINAPRGCPVHNFYQDGHMQSANRAGRVNYEPNGFGEGPREDPLVGYVSYREPVEGPRQRTRPESFGDHYSQARQFYISQTATEQNHISDALAFELAKCQIPSIRRAIVSHLRNIDEALATDVAAGLGLGDLPAPATTATPARTDLGPSPALSIMASAVPTFEGRVLGILIMDGFDPDLLGELSACALQAGATLQIVAAQVMGAMDATGATRKADHAVRGGRSVLFDAIAIQGGDDEGSDLAEFPAAREFVMDAHNHGKFIAFDRAEMLIDACNLEGSQGAGYFNLSLDDMATDFIAACARHRVWSRLDSLIRESDLAGLR